METQNQTNFTFFLHGNDDLGRLVRCFWEIEELPSETIVIVNPEEKTAADIVAGSLTYNNRHYSVGIHWSQVDPS